jgi:4-hydroxythreonine-4-phosphate dehydrogenase
MRQASPPAIRPRIALVCGDPAGIGPELAARLLADPATHEAADVLLISDPGVIEQGGRAAGVALQFDRPGTARLLPHALPEGGVPKAEASTAGGQYALQTLARGIGMIEAGQAYALCFAPLNKTSLHLAGMRHQDELHWFAELLGHAGPISELNVLEKLWTARVTSHVPLMSVGALLAPEAIVEMVALIDRALRAAGIAAPRIAVCGLNPHNGDNGNFGREEIDIIEPGVALARKNGLPASGPFPADTVFVRASRGEFDAVVTMYHDQGQIAMKLMGFDRGVTVAGGLPVPITTPAHGSAFDIVGKGIANPGAMLNAFALACRMTRQGAEMREGALSH